MAETDKLFTPLTIGNCELQHRVVLAPLTRFRAENHIPGQLMATYYAQRASPGGLLVTEATWAAPTGGGLPGSPRIDTPESVAGWKKVVDAVHDKGGFIFLQVFHMGRVWQGNKEVDHLVPLGATDAKYEEERPGYAYYQPVAMTRKDMVDVIEQFRLAAKNAIEAGFDGIEIHGANGYLIDQFVTDNINTRTDEYGGPDIANRVRFPLEIVDAVTEIIGPKKTAYRMSPWGLFQGTLDSDPVEHFSYLAAELAKRGLAYVHVIEPRNESNGHRDRSGEKIMPIKKALNGIPLISAGSWDGTNYLHAVNDTVDALAFGRWFISNPDLPRRLREGIPLQMYDRSTFYTVTSPEGYITYPFATEQEA
ncbi:hypothetical protein CANCADRAFT_22517 [Tortispora caseinolytica NRRL Y-17796]|uniref:NADH:flavin oxidoreductase/NADH oxidase N-terminal domain-containing protein n=1 Tax=Tortispora caseinolytica NRRL Y-17796 TaxID=767744 RepID=A0A1E4TKU7_9ASCO|nr:hypothetical protein CANCADRAFT_22517 [Tortispora caseinolytica NRRL Y-17796]